MTTPVRDRMAHELDQLGGIEDLTADVVARGRGVTRRRRATVGCLAAAALIGGGVTIDHWHSPQDTSRPDAADQVPSGALSATEAQEAWQSRLADVFVSQLPPRFAGVAPTGGGETGRPLEFTARGPLGRVRLNAEVYLDASLPMPRCETTTARECRRIKVADGSATVLRDAYPGRPAVGKASQVWVDLPDGVQAIVNVIETEPGHNQLAMRDLVALGSSDQLAEAIGYASANAALLADHGVTGRP